MVTLCLDIERQNISERLSTPLLSCQRDVITSGENKNSALVSRNILIGGRRTSARLEPDMWSALFDIAHREGRTIHEICTMVSESKPEICSLTAAIRVFITAYFRAAATEEGHARAGHGFGMVSYPDPVVMPRRYSLKNGTNGIPWR